MTPNEFLTNRAFCVLPWTGVYIQPDGEVRNCAITQESIGNINQKSLKSILHGDLNTAIKKDMLAGIKHQRCSTCHNLESNQRNHFDQVSNRIWYIKIIKKTSLDFYDQPENHRLRVLDMRWRNTCNFACVYCGPDLSSQWAVELNMPQKIDHAALEQSLAYIDSQLHEVEHVYLAGGEPLLIKENVSLLNKIYEINPNIEIRVNTNLSIINNTIYNLLKKFKNIHWTVSVDNIGKEFEYVRYGSNWDIFVKNLQQLSAEFNTINFNLVWFVLNYSSVFECIDFLLDIRFHENTFIVNPLETPDHLNILNLPQAKIDELKKILEDRLQKSNPLYALHNSLSLMLNRLEQPFSKDLSGLKNFLAELDARRNLDSRNVFPELYSML
jgi:radical SAM protein with 4Fe4S-binding SPASM domain